MTKIQLALIYGFIAIAAHRTLFRKTSHLVASTRSQGEVRLVDDVFSGSLVGQSSLAFGTGGIIIPIDPLGIDSPTGLAATNGLVIYPLSVRFDYHVHYSRWFKRHFSASFSRFGAKFTPTD